jgi:lysophospholipase L1-like esterase
VTEDGAGGEAGAGPARPARPSRGRLLLAAAGLAAAFCVALELLARLLYPHVVSEADRRMIEPLVGATSPEGLDILRYRPHPYLNYTFNPGFRYADGFAPYNSLGFRAPEWPAREPGVVRVVAVGASTTYGIFSRDGKGVWPALLEQRLNAPGAPRVEVLNLGVTGYTSFELLGVMTMLLPELRPDIVLVSIGVNDAFAACYPDEGGRDNTAFRFSWRLARLPEALRRGMRGSVALRIVGLRLMARLDYLPGDLMTAMQLPHPDAAEARANAAAASGKYFRRNLRTIVALARAAGAEPVLFTQALNPAWEATDDAFYQGAIAAQKRNNGVIADVGREAGVPVVDLFAALRSASRFVDAIHANAEGEALTAKVLYPGVKALVDRVRAGEPAAAK